MLRNEEGYTVVEARMWLDRQANTMLGMPPSLVKAVESFGSSTRHDVAGFNRATAAMPVTRDIVLPLMRKVVLFHARVDAQCATPVVDANRCIAQCCGVDCAVTR